MAQKNRQLAAKNDRARKERFAFCEAQRLAACDYRHREEIRITACHVAIRGTVKTATYTCATPGRVIATHW